MASSSRSVTKLLLLAPAAAADFFPLFASRAPYLSGAIRAAALGLNLPADGKGLGLLAPFLSSDPAACGINSFPRVPAVAAHPSSSTLMVAPALRAGAAMMVRQASVSGQGLATMGSLSHDKQFYPSSAMSSTVRLFLASPALLSACPEFAEYWEELVVNSCFRFSHCKGAGSKESSICLPLAHSDLSVRFPLLDVLAEGLQKFTSSSYISLIYESPAQQMSSLFKVMVVAVFMGSCVLAEGGNSSEQSEQPDFEKQYEEMKEMLKSAQDKERVWRKIAEDGKKSIEEVGAIGKRLVEIGGGGGHEPWWRKLLNLMKNPWAQFAVSLATLPLLAGNFVRVCIESSTGWVYMVVMSNAYLRAPVAEFLLFYDKVKEDWLARFAQRRGEEVPVRCPCGKEVPVKHRCQFCGEELPHVHCGPSCRGVIARVV